MRDSAIRNTHLTVVTIDGDIDAYDTDGNSVTLDETLISVEVLRLQAEYDSKQYARDRAKVYPSQNDQNDMAYWDRQNGTTTLDDAITAVKQKFPK
tara:strand:+ start:669 stop:956 length:288 start_codon:yes stop_codon:yes gene_type:complete